MISKGKGLLLAAALGSILAGPALAQSHGGGHGGGGGGGGGGHFSGGGGGHVSSGAHFGGGGAHSGGPVHYSGSRGYAGGYRGPSYGAHPGYSAGYSRPGYASRPAFTRPGPGYGYPGHYYHGYSTGAYWGGGYWRGGFWPRAYYGGGFAWFLPVLPALYATYWWGGVPYYYANDVYYTYSPDYSGYVATDPPPVSDSSDGSAQPAEPLASPSADPGQVFMYPRNGQSAEQQAQDRTECQNWANQQAGAVAQNGPDYRRAMIACVEGRGYSAR